MEPNSKSKIKNTAELNTTIARDMAIKIAERGLRAIDSSLVIKKFVKLDNKSLLVSGQAFPLSKDGKLVIVSVGKCAIDATKALEEILGKMITRGVVLDVRANNECQFEKIECFSGSHPMPTPDNVTATKKIIETLSGLSADDTVLFVVSGGGSTLLCLPEEGSSCSDEELIVEELFSAGVPIQELNTVRKHMSFGRGGFLAKYAYPAQVISLVFSDVPDNNLEFIASGPTVKDSTTIEDADKILSKYSILQKCNLEHCGLIETPKEDKYFEKVYNTIIVSNEYALEEMKDEAMKLGLSPQICNTNLVGEAQMVGKRIADEISKSPLGTVLLYGGETTVTVSGQGSGGRNQQLALSALEALESDDSNSLVLSLASDGRDNGIYAGAIGDKTTMDKAQKGGLSIEKYLHENDATTFFEITGDLIVSGDTGSNVSDLIIAIKS